MSRATDYLITDGNFWHARCKAFETRIALTLDVLATGCTHPEHIRAALNGDYS